MRSKYLDKIITPLYYTFNALPIAGSNFFYGLFGNTTYSFLGGYSFGLYVQGNLANSIASCMTEDPKIIAITTASVISASPITGLTKFATNLSKKSSKEDLKLEEISGFSINKELLQ